MARAKKQHRIDPTWPEDSGDQHPVSELAADRQGALSPYGEEAFPMPLDRVAYEHPVTVINK